MILQHCLMLIFITTLLAGDYITAKKISMKSSPFKIVCYYGNWAVYRQGLARFTPQNINPYLCTHIIYAFGGFNNDFELKSFDKYNDIEQGNYRKFIELKKYNPRLKTMLAIGGWNEGSARFSRLVADLENRQVFVKSAINFLRTYDFDGLDLDWEYPTFRDGSSLDDRDGYVMLIQELHHAFNNEAQNSNSDKLLLSVAVPAGQDYIDQGFDMLEMSKNVDFLNLLTYDFHTSYEPTANHHSPLYQRPNLPDEDYRANLNVDWTVRYYLQLGVPAFKIIVGIPTYGRGYTLEDGVGRTLGTPVKGPGDKGPSTKESGYMAYYEICRKVKEDGWTVKKPYPNDVGPYAFKGDQWIGFDDEDTVINKAKYIKDKHLGGAMFWSLDNDDFRGQCGTHPNPLITAVRSVLLGKNPKSKKTSQVKAVKTEADNSIPSAAASSNTDSAVAKSSVSRRSTTRFPNVKRSRKAGRQTTTEAADIDENDEDELEFFNTPPTPSTPDPGPAFECKDSGFFQNPSDCKKYFWCLDSGPANLGLVAHAFTCPSGLHFNKRTDACDYPDRVVCKSHTTKSPVTTTTVGPEKKTSELADLLSLIQQLGGVDGVQKFLNKGELKEEVTTTTKRKLIATPKRTLTTTAAPRVRPKSIKTRRTTTARTTTPAESEEEEDEVTTTFLPKTTARKRSKGNLFAGDDDDDEVELFTTRRSRGRLFEDEGPTTPKLTRKYITIQRTTTSEPNDSENEDEPETTTPEPTTTTVPTTTTKQPTTPFKRPAKFSSTKASLFRTTAIRLRTFTKNKKDEEEKLKITSDDQEDEERPRNRKAEEKSRKLKEERKLKTRKEEEEKQRSRKDEDRPRKTTLKRIKSTTTTTPSTTTEDLPKPRSQGRRLQTKRPQLINNSKDFEITGSRVSTTIQKAPIPLLEEDSDEIIDDEETDTSNGILVSTPSLKSAIEIIPEGTKAPQLPFFTTIFRAGDEGISIPTLPSISFPTSLSVLDRFQPRTINLTRRPFPTTPLPEDSFEEEDQIESEAKEIYDDDEEEEYIEETLPPPTVKPRTHRPVVRISSKRPVIRITTAKPTTRRPTPVFRERVTIPATPESVFEYIDDDGEGSVLVNKKGSLVCDREGIFEHPIACNKFVNCVRTMSKLKPWTYTCPPGLMYDDTVGHCNWEDQVDCGDKRRK